MSDEAVKLLRALVHDEFDDEGWSNYCLSVRQYLEARIDSAPPQFIAPDGTASPPEFQLQPGPEYYREGTITVTDKGIESMAAKPDLRPGLKRALEIVKRLATASREDTRPVTGETARDAYTFCHDTIEGELGFDLAEIAALEEK